MLIRPATPDDVPAVLPMVGAVCAMHQRLDPARYPMLPDVVERYRLWLPKRAEDPRSVFLVAQPGPAEVPSPPHPVTSQSRRGDPSPPHPLAGFLIATVERNIPIYTLEEFGFIHDMWVEPPFRRRGVAAALIDKALRRFLELGMTQVRLETAAANDAARRLFESRGFRTGTIDLLRGL